MKAEKHVTMENSTRLPFLAKVRAVSGETPRRPAIHKTAPARTQSRLDTVDASLDFKEAKLDKAAPATQEAEVGASLECRRLRAAWTTVRPIP